MSELSAVPLKYVIHTSNWRRLLNNNLDDFYENQVAISKWKLWVKTILINLKKRGINSLIYVSSYSISKTRSSYLAERCFA